LEIYHYNILNMQIKLKILKASSHILAFPSCQAPPIYLYSV